MLVRLVQIELQPDKTEAFIALFTAHKGQISKNKGCQSLELLQNMKQPNHIATLSRWASQEDLDNYRYSAFFKTLWAQVKPLFAEKAQAISYEVAG